MPEHHDPVTSAGDPLDAIIADYVQQVEAGQVPDREALLAQHPELAARLRAFFADCDRLDRQAGELRLSADPNRTTDATAPADDLPRVRYFGDYELLEVIARGGMGVVYKARQASLNRVVALKMILKGELATPRDVARFRAEAEAAAHLDHPHIVPIYEVGEHDGQHYYAMRYVEGTALTRRPRAEARQEAGLLATVARAVHHAHQHGILHRDLKPSNILVDAAGTPLVADFGLAKRVDAEGSLTESGALVGTPRYMAPEQAAGRKDLTVAADVYSLGVVLYERLTGQTPFSGETMLELLRQVREAEPPRPSSITPGLNRDLETICLKCLEKDPAKRYASAEALADDLERWLRGEPIQARPVGQAERWWRWCRRNPGWAVATAAAFLALATATAFSGLYAVAQKRQADSEKEHADRLADDAEMVRQEQKRTQDALEVAKTERGRADDRAREIQRRLAENYLDRGLALCEQGDTARGVHWLARSLLIAPSDQLAVSQVVRANLAQWQRELYRLNSVLEHDGEVRVADWSPDSKYVLTGSADGAARVWEAVSGKPVGAPFKHQRAVRSVAWSRDARHILTHCDDHTAWVWEAASGKPVGAPLRTSDSIFGKCLFCCLAWSPDARYVLTASGDGTARVWEAASGKPVGAPLEHQGAVLSADWSPDGKHVLTGSEDKTARIWDATSGKPVGPPLKHKDAVCEVAWSPDGKYVLTGSGACPVFGEGFWLAVRIWEAASGQPIGRPLEHQSAVWSVAWSPDSKQVVTGSQSTAQVWDAASGEAVGQPLEHKEMVRTVAWSPDGKYVLTVSGRGWPRGKRAWWSTRVWEAASAKPVGPPLEHEGVIAGVEWSPNRKYVLTLSIGKTVRIWEAPIGQRVGQPLEHKGTVGSWAWSPDGRYVATGSWDHTARVWDPATCKPVGRAMQHSAAVFDLAWSPDGNYLLTGSEDHTARIWEAVSGEQVGQPLQHGVGVYAVGWSPDGKYVLTQSGDHRARVWEAASGSPIGRPLEHKRPSRRIEAWSPDGKYLLTTSDAIARIWEAASGKPVGRPLDHKRYISSAAWSPDGKYVATGSWDNTARIWDAASSNPVGRPLLHKAEVSELKWSPNGKYVLTASKDNSARIWEAVSGKRVGRAMQHSAEGPDVAWSPDGRYVLTGDDDHTAQVWEAASGKPAGPPLRHRGWLWSSAWSPDGSYILTASEDGTARVWDAASGRPVGPPLEYEGSSGRVLSAVWSPDGKYVLPPGVDNSARLWPILASTKGSPQQIALWLSVRTGLELDESGAVHVLDAEAWQQRRQRLEQFGGPPLPGYPRQ
jgi:WD40 repeat protein/tRNA A-37 threonylcarbamoyl transferase component Bud32